MEKYIYLDREHAKKGISLVFAVCEQRIEDYQKMFDNKAIEFIGEDLPHYITYVKTDDVEYVREATREEQYQNGLIELTPGEAFIDGKIVLFDPLAQVIKGNKVVEKTREQLIHENIISYESEKTKARNIRKIYLKALDLYDKAVLRGDINESAEQREQRDTFRQSWLDLPSQYIDITIPIENLYPAVPDFISYFNS